MAVQLLILSSINPLNCMPLADIVSYSVVGGWLYINYTDNGEKKVKKLAANSYVINQLVNYEIPKV